MKSKLLPMLLMSLYGASAWAIQPFVIKDIRVEGIQRTEAGTVFSYLPVKVGEKLDDEKAATAIKALYGTGFFKDVRLEVENDVLIVMVQERPAISQIDFIGLKEFDKKQLMDGLKQVGLAEGRIFDKSLLDKAEQELKRQYLSRGKYAVAITTTVTPLERNRTAISFNISEGEVAKIQQINIVGNQAFPEKELLDLFVLSTPGWMSWWSKNDQYSKQKLAADIETMRSHYLNRGYLEFNLDSTQVSISSDKQSIYITINITEGQKYTVSDIKLAGEMLVPEEELRKLIKIQPGDVFSREKLTETTKLIGDRLGKDGYAFANVNAVPELNKEKQEAKFTFFIDPGRRVYVRRINVTGNTKTRDEVVRREMRQMEGAWYASDKVARSRERIDRLGYFSDVNVETPAVAGTTDQVDMNVSVTEKPTGSIMAGAGFSSSEGFILSGSISQANVFGSGNYLSTQFNTGKINKVYSLSYTNPYYTDDGISRGFDIYKRKTNSSSLSVSRYDSDSVGGGVRFGVPLNEMDTVNFGLSVERTQLTLYTDPAAGAVSPQRYVDYVNEFGDTNSTLRGDIGWARDTRDSIIYPTKGSMKRAFAETGLPGGDIKYYKLSYQHQWLSPLIQDFTLMLNGEAGYANGYGGKPLPFFKSFFAGGNTSVRGFKSSSLGPKDIDGNALGGNRRLVGNVEVLFPIPGMKKDKSLRMSVFLDAGSVFGDGDIGGQYSKMSFSDMRYSTGLAVSWQSPMGPMKFSIAAPLNSKETDKLERFQFILGSTF
ncbi:MAG: outer membrane protein assembly factor BamA [Hydrogenophilales bacterium CG_4_9_14_3_um_filter_59_35]|nr:MAG: outer membrane protein assembly factor BamA [Hydrogenophilales bacterium CG18_big_fil_WC_8_21_14_2_50_58_12]PIY00309.1 MAG: outer membrane protein assembly factor BamA [Hydrogenophilales bacterium CG_4_10_14_3_um_filter_58_23]PJB05186.1 MAG: outer membrane protein assembly factor BamA [Hydrogenophilales bacterium CG_4_9_14_3_um_filter_59_35]